MCLQIMVTVKLYLQLMALLYCTLNNVKSNVYKTVIETEFCIINKGDMFMTIRIH